MTYQFHFNSFDLSVVLCTSLVVISFCCYWFLFVSTGFKASCYSKYPGDEGVIRHIIRLKYLGLIILGMLPATIFTWLMPSYNFKMLGIGFNPETSMQTLSWIAGLGLPIVIVMHFASRDSITFAKYPQIRVHYWDTALMIKYAAAWIVYMFGYEMLFRGLLLFPLANSLGVWPAIAINTVMYVASHLPKGSKETFAALFFGPVLCLITLQTETVWAVCSIHAILAVSNSMTALKYHPEFVIVKNRKLQVTTDKLVEY